MDFSILRCGSALSVRVTELSKSMNVANLLHEFLVGTMGYHDWQVSKPKFRKGNTWWSGTNVNTLVRTNPDSHTITVYTNHMKLHFVIEEFMIDCCLMNGGMSTPVTPQNIVKCLCKVDVRDPGSFDKIKDKIETDWPRPSRRVSK